MSDDQRRLPAPPPKSLYSNDMLSDGFAQEPLQKPPLRAIKIKGEVLRNSIYAGREIDSGEIFNRYVDLWQEARLTIWRAKHSKSGIKTWDPVKRKETRTFMADDKLVLQAIDTTKGVLDSLVKLRRDMTVDSAGIPRWAIKRIEQALKSHPDALTALLTELSKDKGDE